MSREPTSCALSNYDLINDQVNPPDDPSRLVGTVLDFPDAVLSSYSTSGSQSGNDLDFAVTDRWASSSSRQARQRLRRYWAPFDVASFGDANLQGSVNLTDFNTLAANFGQSGMTWQQADFNGDGIVNLTDFNLLAGNFGVARAGGPVRATGAVWVRRYLSGLSDGPPRRRAGLQSQGLRCRSPALELEGPESMPRPGRSGPPRERRERKEKFQSFNRPS